MTVVLQRFYIHDVDSLTPELALSTRESFDSPRFSLFFPSPLALLHWRAQARAISVAIPAMFFSPLVTVSDTLTCLMPSYTRAQQHRLRVMNLLDHPSATRRLLCMSCSMGSSGENRRGHNYRLVPTDIVVIARGGVCPPPVCLHSQGAESQTILYPTPSAGQAQSNRGKIRSSIWKKWSSSSGSLSATGSNPTATNTSFTLLIPTRQPSYVAFGNFDEALKPDIFPKLRLSPQYVLLPDHEPPSPPSPRASTYSSPK